MRHMGKRILIRKVTIERSGILRWSTSEARMSLCHGGHEVWRLLSDASTQSLVVPKKNYLLIVIHYFLKTTTGIM